MQSISQRISYILENKITMIKSDMLHKTMLVKNGSVLASLLCVLQKMQHSNYKYILKIHTHYLF